MILIFIWLKLNVVLSLNNDLTYLEEDILYSHLKNGDNFKFFYEKLIQSNGIDDINHQINPNQVNISQKSFFLISIKSFVVFSIE